MPYRLPPLNTLRVFEAAGRHLSFKAAAEELHVTPSAVSHAIQGLEDWLGVALFVRGTRGLSLSGAGTAYLPQVRQALDALARATEALPGRPARGALSISAAPTFALRWLIPRLPDFQKAHPDVAVTIDTAHRLVDFPRDGIDLAIRMGKGPWPDLYALKLVTEQLVPVASPAVAERLRGPADLAGETLLHIVNVAEDWAAWSRAAGLDALDLSRGLRFDTIQHAMNAAVQGLGVAIGRKPLVDADLAGGALVELFGPAVPSTTAYWLVCGQESLARPEVVRFRDWIRAQLAFDSGSRSSP